MKNSKTFYFFIFILLGGQLLSFRAGSGQLYPFSAYPMYSEAADRSFSTFEIRAVEATGQEVPVNISKHFWPHREGILRQVFIRHYLNRSDLTRILHDLWTLSRNRLPEQNWKALKLYRVDFEFIQNSYESNFFEKNRTLFAEVHSPN